MDGVIVAVASSGAHTFSKARQPEVILVEGLGIEGDAHAGVRVKHRSRVVRDPSQPNLRQVHLLHRELLDELTTRGFAVVPGALGENVTTAHIDLLGLPAGTRLHLGDSAIVEVTGLRNPCSQIEDFQEGLLAAVVAKMPDGTVMRRTGVMAVVRHGGVIRPGDPISIELPQEPHTPLTVV